MILAAYMVAGFTIAGVYAVGLLRGRRDRYHRLGFTYSFRHRRGVHAHPGRLRRLRRPRRSKRSSRRSSPPWSWSPAPARGVTEWIGGIYWNGNVYFGLGIPDFDSLLVGYSPHQRSSAGTPCQPACAPRCPT